jgi:hypothetical protein
MPIKAMGDTRKLAQVFDGALKVVFAPRLRFEFLLGV